MQYVFWCFDWFLRTPTAENTTWYSITTLTKIYGKLFLFFSYYNSWLRKASFASTIALWKKGVDTVRSPLFNQDLTSGIMAALADPGTKGQIFEAMGPQSFVQVIIAWKEYLPNLLETVLLCQIYVFWDRDLKFWLQLRFFEPVRYTGSDFT